MYMFYFIIVWHPKHTILGANINSQAWLCELPVKIIRLGKSDVRRCVERWNP